MHLLCYPSATLRIFLILSCLFVIPSATQNVYMDTVRIPAELNVKELYCVFYCLAENRNSTQMHYCHEMCSKNPMDEYEEEALNKIRKMWKTDKTFNFGYDLSMVCRGDTSVTTRVGVNHDLQYPDYVVIQYKVSNELNDSFYLANNPIAIIDSLQPDTFYKISGFGFKGSKLRGIKEEFHVFPTFVKTFSHEPIKEANDLKVVNYLTEPDCKTCLYAHVAWSPLIDDVCQKRIVWHDKEMSFIRMHKLDHSHYNCTLGGLQFGHKYKVAVLNFLHIKEEHNNHIHWHVFVTPQCREFYTNPADIQEVCDKM